MLIFVLLIVFYIIYVKLIRKKNKVKEAFAGIDVQLKKRYDLIPNIVSTLKWYMKHEKNIFEEIAKLREHIVNLNWQENLSQRFESEYKLWETLQNVMMKVENYPDLKASGNFLHFQTTLNEIEEYISASRRFYNSAVNELNNSVEIFPSSLVAKIIWIKKAMFFTIEEVEKNNTKVVL